MSAEHPRALLRPGEPVRDERVFLYYVKSMLEESPTLNRRNRPPT